MRLGFVNRQEELHELDASAKRGGLLVVYGRRRVGKTRLLTHWLERRGGWYSQAIEAPLELQLQQIFQDLEPRLETTIAPKSWSELLELLSLQKKRWTFCLDEFPYLTAVDRTLPSRLQAWLDHSLPKGCLLLLSGSSTRMMNDLFVNRAAPLFGRADKLLQIRPMDYQAFCTARQQEPGEIDSFDRFACVGGIPKYWEFVEAKRDVVALADALYFDFAPYMEQEPQRILRDEGVAGMNALAVLEAVGRGAERPSEIAGRLGTAQTNLSRLFSQLLDASILVRELPFGENLRTTKKILYRIGDPTLRFWFRVFSPHRSRWRSYSAVQKRKLIHDHAATVFEDACRAKFEGAARYWEPGLELDLVAPDPETPNGVVVAEIKWSKLSPEERARTLSELQRKWGRSQLSAGHTRVRFEIFDASYLRPILGAKPGTPRAKRARRQSR